MNKNKFFTVIITLIIAIAVLILIVNLTFDNNGMNQGNFRISDTILSSIVELEDKSEVAGEWKYDISQNNKISMLVQKVGDVSIKEIYLDKISVNRRNDVNIYIEQKEYDLSYEYKEIKNKKVNIYVEETEDGNYLVEFDIKNKNVVSDFAVSSEVKEIRHDGTILNMAKVSLEDIKFNIKYNLILVQDKGRINTCKVKLEMPNEKIITDGFSAERLDSSNFKFKVNY